MSANPSSPNPSNHELINAIGNTPLIRLRTVSELTGCNIYGKAEFMNPGGSVKDRAHWRSSRMPRPVVNWLQAG